MTRKMLYCAVSIRWHLEGANFYTHRSQYLHLKGFRPICVRRWIVSAPAMAKAFPHPGTSHT